jgi:hypothetical protein
MSTIERSLILTLDNSIAEEIVYGAVADFRCQEEPNFEVVISSIGPLLWSPKSDAIKIIESPAQPRFSLAKARNQAWKVAQGEQLIFCDIDTRFQLSRLPKGDLVRGILRRDVGPNLIGEPYRCACSPIAVSRKLFRELGGYCESYVGWGYEDSDFEHKWSYPSKDVDAGAIHLLEVHRIASRPTWGHSTDQNRELFLERMKLTREQRIAADARAFAEQY